MAHRVAVGMTSEAFESVADFICGVTINMVSLVGSHRLRHFFGKLGFDVEGFVGAEGRDPDLLGFLPDFVEVSFDIHDVGGLLAIFVDGGDPDKPIANNR